MKHLATTVRGLPQDESKADVREYFMRIPDIEACAVGPIVTDSVTGSCSTTVTFQAKKHGRSCEKILRDSLNGSSYHGSRATNISVTDQFLGLTTLAGEPEAPVQ